MDLDLKNRRRKNEEKSDLEADSTFRFELVGSRGCTFRKLFFSLIEFFLASEPIILRDFKNWSIWGKFFDLDIRQ